LTNYSTGNSTAFHSQISWEIQNYPSPPISLPLFLQNDIFNSKKIERIDSKCSRSNKNINNLSNNLNQDDTFNNNSKREKDRNSQIINKINENTKNVSNEYAGLLHENKRYSITVDESQAPLSNQCEKNRTEKSIMEGTFENIFNFFINFKFDYL
jgi:hypothetical protein